MNYFIKLARRLNNIATISEFITALIMLKGIIAVGSIATTASYGIPQNLTVKNKFDGIITKILAKDPKIRGNTSLCLFLYRIDETKTKAPVAIICITIPTQPLPALTVIPCMTDTIMVAAIPYKGPYKKPIKIRGISAGSYSKNGALGNMGKCIKAIKTTDSAHITPTFVIFDILLFIKFPPVYGLLMNHFCTE